jgi:class 3 adenylate cyclase
MGDKQAAQVEFERNRGVVEQAPRVDSSLHPLRPTDAFGISVAYLADEEWLRSLLAFEAEQSRPLPFLSAQGECPRLARGHAALRLGELKLAQEAFDATLSWAEHERAHVIAGECHESLAEVEARLGNVESAARHLDSAAQLFREYDAPFYLSRAIARKLELQGLSDADVSSSILAVSSVVEAEKPSLASTAAPDGTVTLMFSDIVDSTPLNERLGDAAWMALLREHSTIVESEVAEHRGHVVKSMGDGFMVAFPSARDGLRCAIALQRALADRNDSTDQPLEARIGLHTGEAVRDRGDFFGKHVNLAARIGASAAGGEIVVSSLLAQIVEPSGEFVLEAREARAFKGLEGEHVTYGVGWS